jgi:hypothetical protein
VHSLVKFSQLLYGWVVPPAQPIYQFWELGSDVATNSFSNQLEYFPIKVCYTKHDSLKSNIRFYRRKQVYHLVQFILTIVTEKGNGLCLVLLVIQSSHNLSEIATKNLRS